MPPELELARQWLDRARSDLRTAEKDLDSCDPETANICFHCQQTVEKALKGYLVYHGIEFAWLHDIKYLLNLCLGKDHAFEQFLEPATPLTDYAVRFRYPSGEPDPSVTRARQVFAIARDVLGFIHDRLPAEAHP